MAQEHWPAGDERADARRWLPAVASLGLVGSRPGSSTGWHSHALDELCLVDESATTIGHAGVQQRAVPGALFHFRSGERHGYWNDGDQQPLFWVVHYRRDPLLERDCPILDGAPTERILRLDEDRVRAFQGLFVALQREVLAQHPYAAAAEAAWLRLLLVTVGRWSVGDRAATEPAALQDPELMGLWRAVVLGASDPSAALQDRVPNYDALRHRFRRAFGRSPRELQIELRMAQAKTLLLETEASVGEVAARLGYARQHEFARAFAKVVGMPPSRWRERGRRGGT